MTELGLVEETDGWKDLKAWIEGPPKRTKSELARALGISQPAVTSWVARHSRPTAGPLRDALCRLIGSDPERWVTDEDRADAAKLASASFEERTGEVA